MSAQERGQLAAAVIPDDEARLVRAWKQGDKHAGAALFRRYYDPIVRFYRNKAIGQEDLVQRCFLRCVDLRTKIRDESSFRSFIFGVARNVLLEHYRKARYDKRLDFTVQTVEDLAPTPTSKLAKGENESRLLAALRRLPLEQQIAVELYYWEELNAREIAEICEEPEPTIRTRLRRARLRLEKELEQLSDSPAADLQTQTDLEKWARALRNQLDPSSDDG